MSKILDLNGKELQKDIDLANLDLDKLKDVEFDKTWCPIGTELIGHAIQGLIEKDDVVYKLHLVFGTVVYQKRMPIAEVTVETLRKEWLDLLVSAFANHDIGSMQRGNLVGLSKQMKAKE